MKPEFFGQAVEIRNATRADFRSIQEFYLSNHHEFLRARGDDLLLKSIINDRRAHIAIDGLGNLVGASSTFSLLDDRFRELGATRVLKNGFGLQRVFILLRVLQEVVMDWEVDGVKNFDEIYSVAVDDNIWSQRNLVASGFIPWTPPKDLAAERARLSGTGAASNLRFFRLPLSKVPAMAQSLLDVINNQEIFKNGETGKRIGSIILSIRAEIVSYHSDLVGRLAEISPNVFEAPASQTSCA